MLVHLSKHDHADPEEMDGEVLYLGRDEAPEPAAHLGHRLFLRGVMRDGTALTLALSKTECARLYVLLHCDEDVRSWATHLQTCAALAEDQAYSPTGH